MSSVMSSHHLKKSRFCGQAFEAFHNLREKKASIWPSALSSPWSYTAHHRRNFLQTLPWAMAVLTLFLLQTPLMAQAKLLHGFMANWGTSLSLRPPQLPGHLLPQNSQSTFSEPLWKQVHFYLTLAWIAHACTLLPSWTVLLLRMESGRFTATEEKLFIHLLHKLVLKA